MVKCVKTAQFIIVVCLLIKPMSLFADYLIYPKLESGNNLSELYQSSFFIPKYRLFTLTSYISYDTMLGLSYGAASILSIEPYGTISMAYLGKNVDQVYYFPFTEFHYAHKESALNVTYQKKIDWINISLGANVSDPIHLKDFEFNGQVIPSLNAGIQLEPSNYIMIELGLMNVFKEPSELVHDYSEQFYTGASFMLLDDLATRLTLHRFKSGRINMNLLTRYYLADHYFIGVNLGSEPRVLCLSGGAAGSFGSIKVFAGLQDSEFFVFLSYTLFYSVEPRHHKSLFPKSPSAKDNQGSRLVNINTADEIQLSSLPNVGPKTARKIISYRKANGPYYSRDDLMQVTGIGPKKYNKLKHLITVGKLDPRKRLANVRLWTMKEFVELGFSPVLALRLVLFIRDREQFSRLEDLLKLKGFDKSKLERLKAKLNDYKNIKS